MYFKSSRKLVREFTIENIFGKMIQEEAPASDKPSALEQALNVRGMSKRPDTMEL